MTGNIEQRCEHLHSRRKLIFFNVIKEGSTDHCNKEVSSEHYVGGKKISLSIEPSSKQTFEVKKYAFPSTKRWQYDRLEHCNFSNRIYGCFSAGFFFFRSKYLKTVFL